MTSLIEGTTGGGQFATFNEAATLQYVDASGSAIILTDPDNGWIVQPGMQGFGMMPYALLTDEVPPLDGALLRGVRGATRDLFIPQYVEASSRTELLSKVGALANLLDPRFGPGELRMYQPTGKGRRIPVLYTGGMEGDEGDDIAGLHWATFGINLRALDPAWLDVNDITQRWKVPGADAFFPILPLTLISSQIIGNHASIVNEGDEPSYPRWTIVGPMSALTLTNNTTGESFTLTYSLADNTHSVSIDTRPGVKTIVDEAGTNLWPYLSANPQMWALQRGFNDINIAVTGASTLTHVDLTYTPRYKSAA